MYRVKRKTPWNADIMDKKTRDSSSECDSGSKETPFAMHPQDPLIVGRKEKGMMHRSVIILRLLSNQRELDLQIQFLLLDTI